MPRYVVTLSPKRTFRRDDEARTRIEQEIAARYRPRVRTNPERPERSWIELDFSKRTNLRKARDEVAAILDQVEPSWRRLYDLYPTEDALRNKGF